MFLLLPLVVTQVVFGDQHLVISSALSQLPCTNRRLRGCHSTSDSRTLLHDEDSSLGGGNYGSYSSSYSSYASGQGYYEEEEDNLNQNFPSPYPTGSRYPSPFPTKKPTTLVQVSETETGVGIPVEIAEKIVVTEVNASVAVYVAIAVALLAIVGIVKYSVSRQIVAQRKIIELEKIVKKTKTGIKRLSVHKRRPKRKHTAEQRVTCKKCYVEFITVSGKALCLDCRDGKQKKASKEKRLICKNCSKQYISASGKSTLCLDCRPNSKSQLSSSSASEVAKPKPQREKCRDCPQMAVLKSSPSFCVDCRIEHNNKLKRRADLKQKRKQENAEMGFQRSKRALEVAAELKLKDRKWCQKEEEKEKEAIHKKDKTTSKNKNVSKDHVLKRKEESSQQLGLDVPLRKVSTQIRKDPAFTQNPNVKILV